MSVVSWLEEKNDTVEAVDTRTWCPKRTIKNWTLNLTEFSLTLNDLDFKILEFNSYGTMKFSSKITLINAMITRAQAKKKINNNKEFQHV